MKVVVASSGLGHVARGIEAWAADLGRALARRGVDVTLCKGGGRAEAPYERVLPCWHRAAPGTRCLLHCLPRRLSWRVGLGSGYAIEQTTFALRLVRFLREQHVDLLHVQDPQVALIAQQARRIGWITTRTILAHGTEELRSFLRKITYLQHLAPMHLDEARERGAYRPTWTAIPNFIDTNVFRPGRSDALRAELGIPPDGLVVLTAAAIKRRHKRVDHLLGEFAALRRDQPQLPVWLVVAGGWEPETDELVTRGQAMLGDRVRFLVRVPRERMPDLYRTADAFALCSLKEMMPIALLEAIATGLPCLVHDRPLLRWIVGAGDAGIDMAAPGALGGAMQSLLNSPAARREKGDRARQHCLRHFSTDAVLDRILDYYRFVMAHDALPAGDGPELHAVARGGISAP